MSGELKTEHAGRIEVLYARLKRGGVAMSYAGGKIVLEGDARLLGVRTQSLITGRRTAFIALLEMDQIVRDRVNATARE